MKKICISLRAAFTVLLTVSAYFLISDKVDESEVLQRLCKTTLPQTTGKIRRRKAVKESKK